jgi:hypothetical protein
MHHLRIPLINIFFGICIYGEQKIKSYSHFARTEEQHWTLLVSISRQLWTEKKRETMDRIILRQRRRRTSSASALMSTATTTVDADDTMLASPLSSSRQHPRPPSIIECSFEDLQSSKYDHSDASGSTPVNKAPPPKQEERRARKILVRVVSGLLMVRTNNDTFLQYTHHNL